MYISSTWEKRKFFQKEYFPSKTKNNESYLQIPDIWISLSSKFHLKQTISKTEKMNTTIEFSIFELVDVKRFTLNNFDLLDQIYPNMVLLL